jgi:hypothetical protein
MGNGGKEVTIGNKNDQNNFLKIYIIFVTIPKTDLTSKFSK